MAAGPLADRPLGHRRRRTSHPASVTQPAERTGPAPNSPPPHHHRAAARVGAIQTRATSRCCDRRCTPAGRRGRGQSPTGCSYYRHRSNFPSAASACTVGAPEPPARRPSHTRVPSNRANAPAWLLRALAPTLTRPSSGGQLRTDQRDERLHTVAEPLAGAAVRGSERLGKWPRPGPPAEEVVINWKLVPRPGGERNSPRLPSGSSIAASSRDSPCRADVMLPRPPGASCENDPVRLVNLFPTLAAADVPTGADLDGVHDLNHPDGARQALSILQDVQDSAAPYLVGPLAGRLLEDLVQVHGLSSGALAALTAALCAAPAFDAHRRGGLLHRTVVDAPGGRGRCRRRRRNGGLGHRIHSPVCPGPGLGTVPCSRPSRPRPAAVQPGGRSRARGGPRRRALSAAAPAGPARGSGRQGCGRD